MIITSRPSSSDDFSIVSVSDDSTAVYRCAVLSEMWHEILRTCARAPVYEGSDHLPHALTTYNYSHDNTRAPTRARNARAPHQSRCTCNYTPSQRRRACLRDCAEEPTYPEVEPAGRCRGPMAARGGRAQMTLGRCTADRSPWSKDMCRRRVFERGLGSAGAVGVGPPRRWGA